MGKEEKIQDFDEVLEYVGGWNKYQVRLLFSILNLWLQLCVFLSSSYSLSAS